MDLFFEAIMALTASLFTGGALYVSIVEHPARMQLDSDLSLIQFQKSYKRAAPWQGGLAVATVLLGVAAYAVNPKWTYLFGGSTVGLVIPWTLLIISPMNKRLLSSGTSLGESTIVGSLKTWGKLHLVRSFLGAVGLAIILHGLRN
jgi:hypothetical protein